MSMSKIMIIMVMIQYHYMTMIKNLLYKDLTDSIEWIASGLILLVLLYPYSLFHDENGKMMFILKIT